MFNIRSEIDVWDRPVAIDQRMDFPVFAPRRPDPNDTLSRLVFLFLKKLLNRAEPIWLDDDIIIEKGEHIATRHS
jgi:hypothetical protein